ncbi:unnamed protein product [Diamesa serratosioi]
MQIISKEFYCFNEDLQDVQNFHFVDYEFNPDHINSDLPVRIGLSTEKFREDEMSMMLFLWRNVKVLKGLNAGVIMFENSLDCFDSILWNVTDICLVTVTDRTTDTSILPFMTIQYGIYYKIKEFHVSPTFFIDGMSHDLWMFSFITLFLIFLGFLITSKLYCHYLKRTWFISDVFLYQANFWCNQTVEDYLEKFLSWRIQLINGFIFNLIIMTAFTAKFVGLMSIRHFEQPFSTLEDFATLKSHSLCMVENLSPIKYFLESNPIFESDLEDLVYPKWKNILNPEVCQQYGSIYKGICANENLAFVCAANQFYANEIKCPVFELTGFFPCQYASFEVSKGFKHKEKVNQAYLKMQEVGIVDRVTKRSRMKKDSLINFQDRYNDKYNVQDEGVMFDHVKIIVISYFMFLPIPLLILLMEIMIHKYKNQMLRIIHRFANNREVFGSFY